MQRYIRFETHVRCPEIAGRVGVFRAAYEFLRTKKHPKYVHEIVDESCDWFNENLKVPRIGPRHWRAVFWFHTESNELLTRVWPLVNALNEQGIYVHKIRTERPGRIVYSDQLQIAAIPKRYCRQR